MSSRITAHDLDAIGVAKAYNRWAPIYDLVFGRVFARGRSAAVEAADRIGGRILEVGVGTGLSLPEYRRDTQLVGIDLSEPMLEKARERVRELGLRNVEGLHVMDAETLAFPEGSFDVVVAQYVVTAVPHPEVALDEFARVLRPGGEIILTSRIGAERGLRGSVEKILSPVVNRLGWRSEFPWSRYLDWVARSPAIKIEERRELPPLGHFSLIRMRKQTGAEGHTAAA
jgi:phosphatidylethanolamine/phosphatidyl-N-methylethanolamine N-methyltransferase